MVGPSPVTDEVWDDERLKHFLNMIPAADESADFHVLIKAYRGMRAEDFERFLRILVDAGRNPDARDKRGRTLWETIEKHHHSAAFLAARDKVTG